VVGETLDKVMSLPVEIAVRRLVAAAVDGHRVNPKLHCVLAEQIPRIGLLEGVEAVNHEAHRLFRAYLEKNGDEVAVADVGLAAFVCATSIEALAHNAVLHCPELSSDEMIQRLIDETSRLIVGYLKPVSKSSGVRRQVA